MLSLSVHEHGVSLHLFRSSLTHFISIVWFSACESYTYFVRFIPKYFTFLSSSEWYYVLNFNTTVFNASM